MDEQTDSGQSDMPFEFTTNILPFDPPLTADSGLSRPRPDALDFDALTVEPHERELQLRSRFESASETERPAVSMAASPAQPIEEHEHSALPMEQPDVDAIATSLDEPFPKLFDFDPDTAPAVGARRGVLAMAGVTCVALFMTGVALLGNGGNSTTTTAPAELARRDAPVAVRSGVADQAFEYTMSGHELDAFAVEPIVVEVCDRLAAGDGVDEVESDARQRLVTLAPELGEANADAIIKTGVEARCMEHLLTLD